MVTSQKKILATRYYLQLTIFKDTTFAQTYDYEKAHELIVSKEAYSAMQAVLPGVNDDNSMQLLVGYLLQQ